MNEVNRNPFYLKPTKIKKTKDLIYTSIIIPLQLRISLPIAPWFSYDVFYEVLSKNGEGSPANIRNMSIEFIFKSMITIILLVFIFREDNLLQNNSDALLSLSMILVFFSVFNVLLWRPPRLTKLFLHIIEPGIPLPISPDYFNNNPKADDLHIATRLLHPKFNKINTSSPKERKITDHINIYTLTKQYNEDIYYDLFIHICRISIKHSLTNNTKALLKSLKAVILLNRTALLSYFLLIIFTLCISLRNENPTAYKNLPPAIKYQESTTTLLQNKDPAILSSYLNPPMIIKCQVPSTESPSPKLAIGAIGIIWMLTSIFLFQHKINKYHNWLEYSRSQQLSYFLPVFVWNNINKNWIEQTENDLNSPFIGEYGMKTENIINIAGAIALTSFLTWISLYD